MAFYEGKVLHSPSIKYTRHKFLSIHDRGIFACDVLENPDANNNYSEIVLVIPGITGKSPDPYIKRIVDTAHSKRSDILVAVLIQRGFDGLEIAEGKGRKLQAATNLRDLQQILEFLADSYGEQRTRIVAFSFGGIQTRLFLGTIEKTPENTPWYPRAALIASTPLDMIQATFYRFESYLGWMYNLVLTTRLKRLLIKHKISTQAHLSKLKHLRQLDDQIIGPAWGYKGWHDFYTSASITEKNIAAVQVPLIILNSDDDPLIYNDPKKDVWFENSRNVLMARTNAGGHCAFLRFGWLTWFLNEKRCCQASTYYEELVGEFLDVKLAMKCD